MRDLMSGDAELRRTALRCAPELGGHAVMEALQDLLEEDSVPREDLLWGEPDRDPTRG